MILFSNVEAYTLFDYGSTLSFVSLVFDCKLNKPPSTLDQAFIVSTPTGGHMSTCTIFYDCPLNIGEATLPVDLILLPMLDFNIILGMDWLAKYRAVLDCFNKWVRFNFEGYSDVCVVGKRRPVTTGVISAIKASKLLRNGCDGYLTFAIEEKQKPNLEDNSISG